MWMSSIVASTTGNAGELAVWAGAGPAFAIAITMAVACAVARIRCFIAHLQGRAGQAAETTYTMPDRVPGGSTLRSLIPGLLRSPRMIGEVRRDVGHQQLVDAMPATR